MPSSSNSTGNNGMIGRTTGEGFPARRIRLTVPQPTVLGRGIDHEGPPLWLSSEFCPRTVTTATTVRRPSHRPRHPPLELAVVSAMVLPLPMTPQQQDRLRMVAPVRTRLFPSLHRTKRSWQTFIDVPSGRTPKTSCWNTFPPLLPLKARRACLDLPLAVE